jgi:hypothetical protein
MGCESAADSVQIIGKYQQANPLNDPSLSHRGYELLLALAQASTQIVEGALYGQSIAQCVSKARADASTPMARMRSLPRPLNISSYCKDFGCR